MSSNTVNDGQDRETIAAILAGAGLTVEALPEGTTKCCDLRAHDKLDRYLIEIKAVCEDDRMAEAVRQREPYVDESELSPDGSMRTKVRHATKQLNATYATARRELRLIALIERRHQPSAHRLSDEAFTTLYGARLIADDSNAYKCLYFSNSAFFRHRDCLDGAIVLEGRKGALFLNDHSNESNRLAESQLGRFFERLHLLRSACEMETEAGYLVADCDIPRSQEANVLRYIAEKYGLTRAVAMHSMRWAATIPIG